MFYPWHAEVWSQLAAQRERLPHALLITGEPGIGKLALAQHLAASLLCDAAEPARQPCGTCQSCHWLATGNHPDFRLLAPESETESTEPDTEKAKDTAKKSDIIKIDAVRGLADFLGLSSHKAGRKVVVVHPAEALNLAAANALLKTLEEPPPDTLFLLVSHHWRRLLPTLRSRCRRLALPPPDAAQALRWLQDEGVADAGNRLAAAGGAPLRAARQAEAGDADAEQMFLDALAEPQGDVLALAETLARQKLEPERVIGWLSCWVHDLTRLGLTGSVRYYPGRVSQMRPLCARMNPLPLMRYADTLLAATRLAHHPLNARLVFEQLLFDYRQALQVGKATAGEAGVVMSPGLTGNP